MSDTKDYSLLRPFDLEAAEYLLTRLSYDARTGIFRWLPRVEGDKDAKRWNARYAGKAAGSIDHKGYVRIMFRRNGKKCKLLAHRLAWFFINGSMPNCPIDHLNQTKTDNRPCNLRSVSQFENQHNLPMYRNNTSGVTGVSWNKDCKKWMATVRKNGRQHYLGLFNEIESAKVAVVEFRREHGFTEIHGRKTIEWEEPAEVAK